MYDLISRQAAYETLTDYYHHRTAAQHEALWDALKRVPSAEPKRGHWSLHIFHGITGERRRMWTCDNCNGWSVCRTDFCPNCGADMRGEQDE